MKGARSWLGFSGIRMSRLFPRKEPLELLSKLKQFATKVLHNERDRCLAACLFLLFARPIPRKAVDLPYSIHPISARRHLAFSDLA